jgi:uncharacterized protein involved in exopolysaccharide biosynthesis
MERRYSASATLTVAQAAVGPKGVMGVRLDRRYYRSLDHPESLVDTSTAWRDRVARGAARRLGRDSAKSVAASVRVEVPLLSPVQMTVTASGASPNAAVRRANAFAGEYMRLDRATFFAKVRRAEAATSLRLELAREANAGRATRRSLELQRRTLDVLNDIGPRPILTTRPARTQEVRRSPHVARNVRVAALLGLLVGLALVYFPRALHTPRGKGARPVNA